MPTMAKGLNVFHLGQVVPNDEPNDDENGPKGDPQTDKEPEVDPDIDANPVKNCAQSPVDTGEEHIPWSPSPPPCNHTRHASVVNHKRRHSASHLV
jgi:hypothetical protein